MKTASSLSYYVDTLIAGCGVLTEVIIMLALFCDMPSRILKVREGFGEEY
jgi:hypothetical protein